MNESTLRHALAGLSLGGLRYFASVGSTNDEALAWATEGAPDLSVVVADEQTAGRGRLGRRWFTPPGTALAFSVVLRPLGDDMRFAGRTVGLGALAVIATLTSRSVPAKIKWPNDVLAYGRKLAGILVEAVWLGDEPDCQVIGIGLNVRVGSVPQDSLVQFPATSLEGVVGSAPEREQILREILAALIALRGTVASDGFLKKWESALDFLGERVLVHGADQTPISGEVLGLESDGSLRLRDEHGQPITVNVGDVSLRPAA